MAEKNPMYKKYDDLLAEIGEEGVPLEERKKIDGESYWALKEINKKLKEPSPKALSSEEEPDAVEDSQDSFFGGDEIPEPIAPTKDTKKTVNWGDSNVRELEPGFYSGPIVRDETDALVNKILAKIDREIDWSHVKQESSGNLNVDEGADFSNGKVLEEMDVLQDIKPSELARPTFFYKERKKRDFSSMFDQLNKDMDGIDLESIDTDDLEDFDDQETTDESAVEPVESYDSLEDSDLLESDGRKEMGKDSFDFDFEEESGLESDTEPTFDEEATPTFEDVSLELEEEELEEEELEEETETFEFDADEKDQEQAIPKEDSLDFDFDDTLTEDSQAEPVENKMDSDDFDFGFDDEDSKASKPDKSIGRANLSDDREPIEIDIEDLNVDDIAEEAADQDFQEEVIVMDEEDDFSFDEQQEEPEIAKEFKDEDTIEIDLDDSSIFGESDIELDDTQETDGTEDRFTAPSDVEAETNDDDLESTEEPLDTSFEMEDIDEDFPATSEKDEENDFQFDMEEEDLLEEDPFHEKGKKESSSDAMEWEEEEKPKTKTAGKEAVSSNKAIDPDNIDELATIFGASDLDFHTEDDDKFKDDYGDKETHEELEEKPEDESVEESAEESAESMEWEDEFDLGDFDMETPPSDAAKEDKSSATWNSKDDTEEQDEDLDKIIEETWDKEPFDFEEVSEEDSKHGIVKTEEPTTMKAEAKVLSAPDSSSKQTDFSNKEMDIILSNLRKLPEPLPKIASTFLGSPNYSQEDKFPLGEMLLQKPDANKIRKYLEEKTKQPIRVKSIAETPVRQEVKRELKGGGLPIHPLTKVAIIVVLVGVIIGLLVGNIFYPYGVAQSKAKEGLEKINDPFDWRNLKAGQNDLYQAYLEHPPLLSAIGVSPVSYYHDFAKKFIQIGRPDLAVQVLLGENKNGQPVSNFNEEVSKMGAIHLAAGQDTSRRLLGEAYVQLARMPLSNQWLTNAEFPASDWQEMNQLFEKAVSPYPQKQVQADRDYDKAYGLLYGQNPKDLQTLNQIGETFIEWSDELLSSRTDQRMINYFTQSFQDKTVTFQEITNDEAIKKEIEDSKLTGYLSKKGRIEYANRLLEEAEKIYESMIHENPCTNIQGQYGGIAVLIRKFQIAELTSNKEASDRYQNQIDAKWELINKCDPYFYNLPVDSLTFFADFIEYNIFRINKTPAFQEAKRTDLTERTYSLLQILSKNGYVFPRSMYLTGIINRLRNDHQNAEKAFILAIKLSMPVPKQKFENLPELKIQRNSALPSRLFSISNQLQSRIRNEIGEILYGRVKMAGLQLAGSKQREMSTYLKTAYDHFAYAIYYDPDFHKPYQNLGNYYYDELAKIKSLPDVELYEKDIVRLEKAKLYYELASKRLETEKPDINEESYRALLYNLGYINYVIGKSYFRENNPILGEFYTQEALVRYWGKIHSSENEEYRMNPNLNFALGCASYQINDFTSAARYFSFVYNYYINKYNNVVVGNRNPLDNYQNGVIRFCADSANNFAASYMSNPNKTEDMVINAQHDMLSAIKFTKELNADASGQRDSMDLYVSNVRLATNKNKIEETLTYNNKLEKPLEITDTGIPKYFDANADEYAR